MNEAYLIHSETPKVYLQHHGIKGQRWGVRREKTGYISSTAKKAAKNAVKFEKSINKVRAQKIDKINRGNLPPDLKKEQMNNVNTCFDAGIRLNKAKTEALNIKTTDADKAWEKDKEKMLDIAFADKNIKKVTRAAAKKQADLDNKITMNIVKNKNLVVNRAYNDYGKSLSNILNESVKNDSGISNPSGTKKVVFTVNIDNEVETNIVPKSFNPKDIGAVQTKILYKKSELSALD